MDLPETIASHDLDMCIKEWKLAGWKVFRGLGWLEVGDWDGGDSSWRTNFRWWVTYLPAQGYWVRGDVGGEMGGLPSRCRAYCGGVDGEGV